MREATWWDLLHDAVVQNVTLSEDNLTLKVEIRNLNRFCGWNKHASTILVFEQAIVTSFSGWKGSNEDPSSLTEISRLKGCWIIDVDCLAEAQTLSFALQGNEGEFDWWSLVFKCSDVNVWMPDGKVELDEALSRGASYWHDFATRKSDDLMR